MKRLALNLTLASLSAGLLFACGDDGSATDEGTDDGSSTGDDDSNPDDDDANPDDSADGTDTGPDTADDSSGDDGCEGDCQADGDCLPGQSCIECICVGEPDVCLDAPIEGQYGPCVMDGMTNNAECGNTEASCLINADPPTAGVCFFSGCEEACDCPAGPEGFEDQVVCQSITANDDDNDCFISCSGGQECPEGMFCLQGTVCLFGEPPPPLDPYGDCVNEQGSACPEGGLCLVDDVMNPTEGVCAQPCETADECLAKPDTLGGTAEVYCQQGFGDMGMDGYCFLGCSNGATCPDGMECFEAAPNVQWCQWPVEEPAPAYGDCSADAEACLDTEACVDGTIEAAAAAVCGTTGCDDAEACPASPGGTAAVACNDLDAAGPGENTCVLDCSADGATCPDGMACGTVGDFEVCLFESAMMSLPGGLLLPKADVSYRLAR